MRIGKKILFVVVLFLMSGGTWAYLGNYYQNDEMKEIEFFVGTYTKKNSEGIYKYVLLNNGKMILIGLAAKSDNPSFIAKSSDNNYLFAVNENIKGVVECFKINKNDLEVLNKSSSGGAHPCFITTNNDGYVLVSNYSSGNVGLLQLRKDGISPLLDVQQHYGRGVNERQEAPHAHSTWFVPNSKNIVSVDLGTNELIFSSIDTKTKKWLPLESKLKMTEGAGPRHLAFHPDNKWIYVVNELNSTVSLVKKNGDKYTLNSSYSTQPKTSVKNNTCADIHLSKDGKFLYASNRGHNSIAIFSIGENGGLTFVGHESTRGDGPRNFSLSPNNEFLLVANQHTDNIVSFKRDTKTGKLEYVSEIKAHTPVCLLF